MSDNLLNIIISTVGLIATVLTIIKGFKGIIDGVSQNAVATERRFTVIEQSLIQVVNNHKQLAEDVSFKIANCGEHATDIAVLQTILEGINKKIETIEKYMKEK